MEVYNKLNLPETNTIKNSALNLLHYKILAIILWVRVTCFSVQKTQSPLDSSSRQVLNPKEYII